MTCAKYKPAPFMHFKTPSRAKWHNFNDERFHHKGEGLTASVFVCVCMCVCECVCVCVCVCTLTFGHIVDTVLEVGSSAAPGRVIEGDGVLWPQDRHTDATVV